MVQGEAMGNALNKYPTQQQTGDGDDCYQIIDQLLFLLIRSEISAKAGKAHEGKRQ